MKIITKCIIDMETLQIIEEDSYEYTGDVSLCKGGGGGGSSSGTTDYQAYMKAWHGDALDDNGADVLTSSMNDVINSALGNSPWLAQTAYDPDADLVNLIASPNVLQTMVTLLSAGTTLDTLISNVLDTTRIDTVVTEYAADLDARLISDILPRFNSGMRDINAVQSSAFVIGKALIEENQDRQIAKFSADMHNKAESDDAIKVIQLKLEYQKSVSQLLAEAYRVKIVAKKEENDVNMDIDEKDAMWDLELFQYGGNLLAAIGGGVANPKAAKGPSQMQSAIGGAMSGAAAGGMIAGASSGAIAGPVGIAAGAMLGLASSFM